LYATRLLEVDAAGALVWETSLLTLARQLGKTWFLHDICSWRLEQGARFGAPQEVVSIAKDLSVSRKMQQPARARAKSLPGLYRVREVNGQEEIELLVDGSRWMIRSKDGVYGLTASMATVDEGWKVSASVIDDGLVPTMIEQPQSQLLLISTAHRRATALMIGRRAGALDRLADPDVDGGTLLIEWSAPPSAELEDRAGWRLASPHWTAKRERWIAERLAAARSGESDDIDEPDPLESFQTQWLNRWPAKRLNVQKGEELVDAEMWAGAVCDADSVGPLWIGVEDHFERGAAVAFCGALPDGRFVVGGELCRTRADAYRVATEMVTARPGSTLVVGAC
jgi:phage terminase large subunit-like protein